MRRAMRGRDSIASKASGRWWATAHPTCISPRALTVAFLLGWLGCTAAWAGAGPWQENEASRVRLISPWERAPRSGEVVLGLEFRLEPGWHVYWKNSGDAGYPPALDFGPTAPVRDAEILWPAPERYDLRGGLVAFGYHDHVVYPVRVTFEAPEGTTLEIAADLDYVVCEVDCIPYSYRLTLAQPLVPSGTQPVRGIGEAELVEGFLERVPSAVEARPGVRSEGRLDLSDAEEPVLHVGFEGVEPGDAPELFFEPHETFEIGRPTVTHSTGEALRFTVPVSFRQVPETLPERADLAWTVTGLLAPDDALEARRSVPVGAEEEDRKDVTEDASPPLAPVSAPEALAWALLSGLLLHWTPPLLAILIAQVATWHRLSADLVRRRAGATVLGLVVGAAAVSALAGTTSRPLFWGLQFQEPTLLAWIAVTALLLAVNLWGLTDLPLTRSRGGGLVAGVAAALLALPWDLPLLGGVFGAAPDVAVALALGTGLVCPYLVLCAWPDLVARGRPEPPVEAPPSPRRLRPALGFLAAGTLLWLVYLLRSRITTEGLALFELGLLVLGLLFWARGRWRNRLASATCGLAALLLAIWLLSLVGQHRLP